MTDTRFSHFASTPPRRRFCIAAAVALAPVFGHAQTSPTAVPTPDKLPVLQPSNDKAWDALEKAHWISDGQASAPRIVYVFTDANCPYCNRFWSEARPWVDAGKVQLRHVIVGILAPTSPGKAAALLSDKNPARALNAYERRNAFDAARNIASGHPRPLNDESLQPLQPIPAAVQAEIDGNERLMASLGLRATPAFAWREGPGTLQTRTGIPEGELTRMLGPR
jgi:thiol:disulfide interchange protein DsbG